MIRFFRTIRQNLLAKGREIGYATYAIGEIPLNINAIHSPVKDMIWVGKFATTYPVPPGKASWRLKPSSKISDEANLQSAYPISLLLKNDPIYSIHV